MTPLGPLLTLESGFEIGHGPALIRREDELTLGSGTHLLVARNNRSKTTLLRTLARTLKPISGMPRFIGSVQNLPEDLRIDPELPAKAIFQALLPPPHHHHRGRALALAERIELDLKNPIAASRLATGVKSACGSPNQPLIPVSEPLFRPSCAPTVKKHFPSK